MANNTLEYLLKIKDEASKTLEKFGRDLDIISKNGQKGLENLSKSFLGVGGVMTGVGVATGLVAKDVLKMAGNFEQALVAYQTLTGSMETGTKLFEDLKTFSKTTPFNFKDIQEYTKRLLAMGSPTDSVIEDLRMLGDVASGVGMEKMPQLILAFGQIRSKGRLMGEELRQLREAGFNLADGLGVTNAELEQMVARKEISFEDVRNAFVKATGEGGLFFQMMEKQSQTALGKFSNLQDGIDIFKASLGDALLPTMKRLLDVAIPFIEKLGAWAEANPKLIQMIFTLGGAFLVVGGALVIIGTVLGGLVLAFGTAGALMVGAVGLIVVAIIGLVAAFFIWRDEIIAFLKNIWTAISTFFTNLWTSITEFVSGVWTSITTFFTNIFNSIIQFFTNLYQTHKVWIDLIVAIFQFFFDFVKMIFENLFTVISYVVQLIWSAIQIAWTLILDFTIPIFNKVKDFLTSIWNFILDNVIKPVINSIKSVVKIGFEFVKQNIITPITEAYTFLSDKFDAMYNKVVEIKDKIVNKFKELAEGITNALKSIKFPHLSIGEGSTNVAGKEIKYPKLNVDWYEKGGWVGNTGLAMVHEGEFVLSKDMLSNKKELPQDITNNFGGTKVEVSAIINTPIDVIELGNILGQQLAFAGR